MLLLHERKKEKQALAGRGGGGFYQLFAQEREKKKNPLSLVTFPSLTHHRICVPAPPSPKSMKKCSAFCIIIDTILHSNTAAIVL